jgi:hypothetical protein
MKVEKIKINYPNGQAFLEMGPIEAPVNEIMELMARGMQDVTKQLPELTKQATLAYDAYKLAQEEAKNRGLSLPS